MIFSRESKEQSLLGGRGPARTRAGFSVFVLHGCEASGFVLHGGGEYAKQMRLIFPGIS